MSWERRKATIKGGSTEPVRDDLLRMEEGKLKDWTRVGFRRKRWRRVRVRRRWNWERKRSLEGWAVEKKGEGGRKGKLDLGDQREAESCESQTNTWPSDRVHGL